MHCKPGCTSGNLYNDAKSGGLAADISMHRAENWYGSGSLGSGLL